MSTGKEKPKNSAQGDPAKDELAKRLEAVGLSAEYWLPKLHKQLGVTSAQALKHLQYEDYLKLECDVQHTWEKQALRELLKIDSKETMKQLQEQRLEMLKKRQEQAKAALQELKEMQEKGRSHPEEAVRKKEEELRQAMDLAPEYWAPSEKPLIEVMENVHKQLDVLEESVSQSENLPDKEVLRWASGGLALQGIYKTNQLTEMAEKQEQLIDIPEGFELFGPQQGPLFEKKEFLSAEAESTFTKAMEKLGFSISTAAKGGFGAFSAETSTDYRSSSESEETHRSRAEDTYICTTKYSYIPLASCYFPKDQLRLSRAALQELKEIEQLLRHTPEPDKPKMLESRGGSFFKRFGSHVNQGPLHFGGIFWWKASSEGFRAEQLDEVKKRTSDALSSYVGGSYSGFGLSIAGGVNVSKSGSEASFQGTDRKQTQTEIQLFVTKTGGPLGVDSLTAWKSGLLASNKTWSVIDRGSQLIPVWDIILSNHRQDFNDVYKMSSSLTRAYEALTKLSACTLVGEELASAVDEARTFLEEMKTWEVTGDEEQLVTLLSFKQKLNEKMRSPNVWINICLSDKVLQDFLENTVSLCRDLPASNEKSIRSLLYCLLDPYIYSVKNFPKSSFIMQWIFQSAEQAGEICSSDLTDFIKVLQQMESDIREATAASINSPAAQHEAQRKATLILSLSIHSLLQALRKKAETDTELLLLSVATSAGYRVESHTFQYLLGCPEINFMLKEMRTAHERYLTLRDQDVSRAQGFLLLTGLTVAAKHKVMTPEEKKKYLTFIKDHMGNSLSQEVTFVLTKHRALTDWKALERDLNSLVNGNFEATNDDQLKEYIKKDLENVFQEIKQVNSPVSTSKEVQSRDTKTYEFPQNSGFLKLIKRLKLENYYPNKMGMADFQKIHKTSLHDRYPSNESELPFYFLDKLLMLDYRVRYLICNDGSKTKQGLANILTTSDYVNEPTDNLDDIFNDDDEESNTFAESNEGQVHPMDIQMAIFHCADDFMRQYISTKLSLCQFALPLLVPHPCTSQIEFPLWSFCQVNKKWQSHGEFQNKTGIRKCKDKLIYQTDIPVVSFIRFGASSFSKSQLLNILLSKQKHSIFFHRHCRSSSKNCLLMEGVVEIAWYCPGRDDDSFDSCIAFTNLHGDAREHEQQIKFLQEIASVNVVLLSDTDRNEKGTKVLQDLLKSPKPVIFLCVDKERIPVNKYEKRVKIAVKNQNEAKLMDHLTTAIKRAVETSNIPCSLGKCANIAQKHGFCVDEDKRECKEGKELAQKVMGFLKQKNILDKDKLLPLQGELWHKWCKKDKERTHLQDDENMGIEQHLSQIKSEKHAIRQDQLQRAFPLNELMQSVLSTLNLPSHKTKMYFLQWLKVFTADLSSDHLPELHRKYHDLWSQTLVKKQREENNDLQKQLEKLSHEINESTFGLEHLLREVGQIYEALDAYPEQDKRYHELPKIVADLMVEGYPIELLDGDTSYVPLKWVGAIFDKLIENLGDKKVFVLSVLGIQSTGKSTLLNAMFGLQFNVSAGRCTKGAFMQLIKVDDELREELNFDFVVVIDTEGLRSTKLENRSALSHDNELATFVIGLGNMTLINIFGENPSEMQDILQIAVQAFLRMKQVKLSPSCLFVHQNVGDITANEKNMEGRRRLQEKLDEVAVTAAKQEFYDVTCFSDVIQFDVNTHIHYFPHLWEGDPPMAPPNPSYSQNVQELKSKILMAAKEKSEGSFLRLSELKTRTQNLWEALLNENFVFSFKNTQEIVIYNRLENNYNQWTWELRRFMLDLQNKLNIQIQNGRISEIDKVDLEKRVQEKYDATEKDLERYFSEDKECNILIQWKTNIKGRMDIFRQELIDNTYKKGQELIKLKNRQSRFEQRKSTYKDELLRKSKELARDFRDKDLSEKELRDSFISMWNKWVTEVSSAAPRVEEPNINGNMEIFLCKHFKSEHNIRKRIKRSSQWTVFPLNPSEHISVKGYWYERKTAKDCDIEYVKTRTSHLEQHIYEYIEKKESEIMNYSPSYFHEIVELISKELESDSEDDNFTLTHSYKVDVSLYLCQMATRKFRETFKAFQKSNDPVRYLESKREEFFSSFKISCQGATSITTFADILCSNLKSAICHAVYDKTAIDIANEMRSDHPTFNGNRSKLEFIMLYHLLGQEDFEKYQEYIYNPSYHMADFIKRQVDRYCLDKKNPKLKNFLNLNLDSFQTLVLSAVHESTKVVKDKHGNVASWLDEFCTRLGDDLYLPRSNLQSIEHQEIKDIRFLKEVVSESLIPALEQLKQTFSEIGMDPFVSKPHEILFEQLCGCLKQCPFCKAVCMNTIPGHDGDHSTHFHRPQALAGIQWEGTNHLVTDICSSLVASDSKIVLDRKIIPCKNYREVGPAYANWDIKPDTLQMSYWKWFVSHFRSDLEKIHDGKFEGKGAIPTDWKNLHKNDAVMDLIFFMSGIFDGKRLAVRDALCQKDIKECLQPILFE